MRFSELQTLSSSIGLNKKETDLLRELSMTQGGYVAIRSLGAILFAFGGICLFAQGIITSAGNSGTFGLLMTGLGLSWWHESKRDELFRSVFKKLLSKKE